MRTLLVFLQAAATTTFSLPPAEKANSLSLGPRPCPTDSDSADIVVCAKRHTDRLGSLPDRPGPPELPPMTVRLPGGGAANLHAADSSLPGGHGVAAMVTVKIPF